MVTARTSVGSPQAIAAGAGAAWVGIIAGSVFTVAVIFGTGFIVGKHVGDDPRLAHPNLPCAGTSKLDLGNHARERSTSAAQTLDRPAGAVDDGCLRHRHS